jgi:hypothetical protein
LFWYCFGIVLVLFLVLFLFFLFFFCFCFCICIYLFLLFLLFCFAIFFFFFFFFLSHFLFFRVQVHSLRPPDLAVVEHIWQCYHKEVLAPFLHRTRSDSDPNDRARPDSDPNPNGAPDFYPIFWISKIVFRDYLLEEDIVEVPHPVLLQKFSPIARKMADFGFLIRYFAYNHSNICVTLRLPDGKVSFIVNTTRVPVCPASRYAQFPYVEGFSRCASSRIDSRI